jgi:hypothetical protein
MERTMDRQNKLLRYIAKNTAPAINSGSVPGSGTG